MRLARSSKIILLVFLAMTIVSFSVVIPAIVFAGENDACIGCLTKCPQGQTTCKLCSKTKCGGGIGGVGGFCALPGICKGNTSTGLDGKSMNLGDLSKLFDGVAKILQALKGGEPPPAAPATQPTNMGGANGCTQYYQVSTPSADPCAYYVPQTSTSLNIDGTTSGSGVSDLLDALGGDESEPVSVSGLIDTNTTINTNTDTNTNNNTSGATAVTTSIVVTGTSSVVVVNQNQTKGVVPGISGDIQLSGTGVTAIIMNPNIQGNSVVAGFYGSDTLGGQSQSVAAQWCRTRPWSKNFLSSIIPPTFFDNLCTLRGFPVGTAQVVVRTTTPTVTLTQSRASSTAATSTRPVALPMQADIWAVPASVRLGTRTTVFWNSKNAATCTETSSDGSFSQNSLSGGAATVPLSGPTTFTILCTGPDGKTITNQVTVNLAI